MNVNAEKETFGLSKPIETNYIIIYNKNINLK